MNGLRHCLFEHRSPSARNLKHCSRRQTRYLTRDALKDSRWPGWEVVIGIEVHAQIKSKRKLFSDSLSSSSSRGDVPNSFVSPFDAAFPGTLPKLNQQCVKLAIRAALGMDSNPQRRSAFDRKHYFYADLPAGYQITQNYSPIARGGRLHLPYSGIDVRIKQIQLEQDTAKTTYDPRCRLSTIDLNRAGMGLMEIVSEADMRSPEEAAEYILTLQSLLRALGSSDGNMEQGSFRCDVNVSVNRPGERFGTRCEVKNLNSIRFMQSAIASEVQRQTTLLEADQPVEQETRGFDEQRSETFRLRSKEDAPDYRYMPDPNLPPLILPEGYIEDIRHNMPELPAQTRTRLRDLGLTTRDIDVLMSVDAGKEVGFDGESGGGALAFFDTVRRGMEGRDVKVIVNWLTHELPGQLSARGQTFTDNPLSAEQFGQLIDMIQEGRLTRTSGKYLLRHLFDNPSPCSLVDIARNLNLLNSPSPSSSISSNGENELRLLCLDTLEAMPSEVAAFRKGSKGVMNKLLGRVVRESRGRVDARAVRTELEMLIRDEVE